MVKRSERGRQTAEGVVMCVGGPHRPSTVEVVVGLSHELAERGVATLAVDFDEYSPLLEARLGLDDHPTVGFVRRRLRVDRDAALDRGVLGRITTLGFETLTGVRHTNPGESPLGAGDVRSILAAATEEWEVAVTGVGPIPLTAPSVTEASGFVASRQVVEAADVVVAVMEPTPLGLLEGLDWATAVLRINRRPIWIVFSQRPKSSLRRREFVGEVRKAFGVNRIAGAVFAPIDVKREELVWSGEVAGTDRFAKGMARLVDKLLRSGQVCSPGERLVAQSDQGWQTNETKAS